MRWPNERQWVTLGVFSLTVGMMAMAVNDPKLWEVKLFEVVFQAIVLTGLLNLILAFHFASNKGSETARENTGKAFDTMTAIATGQSPSTAGPTGTPDDPLSVAGAEPGSAPPVETKDTSK